MRTRALLAISAIAVVMLAVPQVLQDVDAADGDVWYCYSHDLAFYYEGGTADLDDVEWTAVGIVDGVERSLTVTVDEDSTVWMAYLDREEVSECDSIRVTQTVVRDDVRASETQTFIPVRHIDDGRLIRVIFHDGYTGGIVDAASITPNTVVRYGDDFVILPDAPVRQGYEFTGWFMEDGQEFDPGAPIVEDTDVYAHWTYTGGGSGGGTVIIDDIHVVTFDVVAGLDYTVGTVTSGSVTFTVSVAEGFTLEGDPEVTATGGTLSNDGMTYVLSSIDRDIVVTIGGDVRQDIFPVGPEDDPPAGSGDGGPPWIWILIVLVIAVVAAVAYWYLRKRE